MPGRLTVHTLTPAQHAALQSMSRPAFMAAARAYRAKRLAGQRDFPAWRAATAALREAMPELEQSDAGELATLIVARAAQDVPDWFWGDAPEPNHGV